MKCQYIEYDNCVSLPESADISQISSTTHWSSKVSTTSHYHSDKASLRENIEKIITNVRMRIYIHTHTHTYLAQITLFT